MDEKRLEAPDALGTHNRVQPPLSWVAVTPPILICRDWSYLPLNDFNGLECGLIVVNAVERDL